MPDPWSRSGVSSLPLHVALTTSYEVTEPPAPRIGDHGTPMTSHRRNPHRFLSRFGRLPSEIRPPNAGPATAGRRRTTSS
jgi:hypothetical protein